MGKESYGVYPSISKKIKGRRIANVEMQIERERHTELRVRQRMKNRKQCIVSNK